jgi:homoserine kinase
MKKVTYRVPSSTSNLGPGFDTLGIALKLYAYVTLEKGSSAKTSPFMKEAISLFFKNTKIKPFAVKVTVDSEIPQSRGLGSSAAIRIGILCALNDLTKQPLTKDEIFLLASELEGHPDNVGASLFGGFVAASENQIVQFEVQDKLKFIAVIPDLELSTEQARKVLPKTYSRADVVKNIQNVGQIVAAFAEQNYDALENCFEDTLHQPYRQKLIPGFKEILNHGKGKGFLGAFLSGSGTTMMLLTTTATKSLDKEIQGSLAKYYPITIIHHLHADNIGAKKVS